MANETVVRVTADVAGYTAELDKARRSADVFIAAQEAAARRTKAAQDAIAEAAKNGTDASARAINSFVSQTARMADSVGKTRSQLLEQRAAQLGVSEAVSDYINKLKAAEQASTGGRRVQEALDGIGMSARQTAAAMRMVPAQMTDIVTQLAGGQSPLLILTQQGGQLRDMFGGFGPAVRAVGGFIAGLLNPVTILGGAAVGLAVAFEKGAGETRRFNDALTITGGVAGVSADQMATMAKVMSDTAGTQGKAAETLAALASTGKIAGSTFLELGNAAQAWEKATGAAIEKTVEEFVKLGEEPVKASQKLNEQYHYLTAAVFEQIAALEDQGRKEEAATLAQRTYASAMKERADQVVANVGYMQRAWAGLTSLAKGAWDAMLGVGRDATLADVRGAIERTKAEIAKLESSPGAQAGGVNRAALARARMNLEQLQAQAKPLEAANAAAEAKTAEQRRQDAVVAAQARLRDQEKATRSRADIRKEEIEQLNKDAKLVGMAADEYAKRLAAIEDKYKDPKGAKARQPKAFQDDAATRFLQQLREQDAATRAALESSERLTGAEKQQAEFLQKISDLKGKAILTAEQKSLLANQDQVKAQLAQNVENERALKLKTDIQKVEERSAAVSAQIGNMQRSQSEQYQRQLDATGRGTEAQKQAEAVRSIYREYKNLQLQLEKATPEAARGSAAYIEAQQRIRSGLDQSLQDYDAYYSSLREKQADWLNGATEAVANYAESSRNQMAQASSSFSSLFKGMEDVIVQFSTTGKLNFGSFAQAVIADLIRIQARAALSGIFSQLGNMVVGALGGSMQSSYGGIQGSTDFAGSPIDMSNPVGIEMRAAGGHVNAGQPYVVGEVGPEVFVPTGSGSIVPNDALSGPVAAGGGDVTITQHIHVDSRSDQASIMQAMMQAKNAAVAEVKQNLARGGDMRQLAGR
ncbi:phage tail tape measure protein [Cupriavidus taiwanensis]|uniref:Histone H1 n=1 Tax=Cupriavidus taiwanensis TaxID=164546 RepID=A0A375IWP1_9BURK|nr:phage tail tape measure protein [Cupriavidus taiwanensis]SPR97347.1 Histone H1 [Cupriavidus taiwanensis]